MRINKFVISCLFLVLMLAFVASAGFGKSKELNNGLQKPVGTPAYTLLNCNLLSSWLYSDGISNNNPNTGGGGLIFPRGTYSAGVVYTDGLVWAGYIMDDRQPALRMGGTTYVTSLQAGAIISKGEAEAPGADDVRIWRIRPDFATVDLSVDVAELVDGSVADVTAADVADLRNDYLFDWQNWPIDKGAPFYDDGYLDADGETIVGAGNDQLDWGEDANMNGVLDSGEDANGNGELDGETPGFAGADQVVWFVANDLDDSRTNDLGGCPPSGFEVQVTSWGYNRTDALGYVMFKKFKVIYKGASWTPDDASADSLFYAKWSDPDLGAMGDDFVGCDTVENIMYAYNSTTLDGSFVPYELPPPCSAYDFLQGPLVDGEAGDIGIYDMKYWPGKKNLGMVAFNYFAAGSAIDDPDMQTYEGTGQWYNLMNGLKPRAGVPFTDENDVATKFPLSGDPKRKTGHIDGMDLPPGDRRYEMITGPVDIAFGDTSEIVVAYVVGMGSDNISSIDVMRYNDVSAQYAYDNFFDLAKPPSQPNLNVTVLDEQIILNWGWDKEAVAKTENIVQKGYAFEGYNVYQLPSGSSQLSEATRLVTFDLANDVTTILDAQFDPVSGQILQLPSQLGRDSRISRTYVIDTDAFTSNPLVNGTSYYFAVTSYSYNADETVPIHALECAPLIKSAVPQTDDPGYRLGSDQADAITTTHSSGTADVTVDVNVVDPTLLTGHDYKVWWNSQHFYSDGDGVWKTNYPDSIGKLGKPGDLRPSTLTAAGVWSKTDPGAVDINFLVNIDSPDWDYCDGIKLTFPEGTTVNSVDGDEQPTAIYDNVVMIGDSSVSTAGHFAGGETVSVNVSDITLPLTVRYTLYDDGWGMAYDYPDGVYNAYGTLTIEEVGNDFVTVNYWNLWDVDLGMNVLENQTILGGFDGPRVINNVFYPGDDEVGLYAVRLGDDQPLARVVDGFEIDVTCGYSAPTTFLEYCVTNADGEEECDVEYGDALGYVIYSFGYYGWGDYGPGATAADDLGPDYGTDELDLLQRDYELRFTGVEADPITVGDVTYHPIEEGTGSLAILFRMRTGDIKEHPDPNNPGNGDPFFVRIPFEVWDMEDPGGPRQIMMVMLDRYQDAAEGGDFYPFNYDSRMYCDFLMEPYDEVIAGNPKDYIEYDGGMVTPTIKNNTFTWNVVFQGMPWEIGDVVHLTYANPIVKGTDEVTFSTAAVAYSGDLAKKDIKEVNVFPNPYYGFNPRETTTANHYVTFNHLPPKATIKIFDLAGNLVRTLEKDGDSQYFRWDLNNHRDLPVASGIYIAHIDMPDLKKSIIRKIAVIASQQYLEFY